MGIMGMLPGFSNTDDTTLGISARVEFTNALFNHPELVPLEVLWSWLGTTFLMAPANALLAISKQQNSTNFFEAGSRGLPLLVLDGDADKFLLGDEAYKIVAGRVRDIARHTTKNDSHVFFYEQETEFVGQLVKFGKCIFQGVTA